MKESRFGDGTRVQVGFWDSANAQYLASGQSSVFTAETIVYVAPTADGVWVTQGTNPTAAATTNGNSYIPFGVIAVFAVDKDEKLATTGPVSITPVK